MLDLKDQVVWVLGLGASGLAMVRWARRHGAKVSAWDSRQTAPADDCLSREMPEVTRVRGPLGDTPAADITRVYKSPGLSPKDPAIQAWLQAVQLAGVRVAGELDLFAQALKDLSTLEEDFPSEEEGAAPLRRSWQPKILAITGTNGKTTTTSMTALLVQRAGRRVAVAGNIGPTLLDTLTQVLDGPRPLALHAPQVWVLELSSFQLEGVQGFEPDAAVVLNLSEDHLDWHGDMDAYVRAKGAVYGSTAVMVVNRDDARCMDYIPAPVPAKGRGAKPVPRSVIRFGLGAPEQPGDWGLVQEGGMAWLARALPLENTPGLKPSPDDELVLSRLMPADAMRVRGRHNAANALAALALTTAIGLPLAPMLHGLRDYAGEPHRVQFVATVGGVDFYDDSKGTNVGATVAAIDGLGQDRSPARLLMILGGDGKGQDFSPLRAPLLRHARAIVTLGKDAPAIESALAGIDLPMQRVGTLVEATRWAAGQAQSGDVVLLSPACASLDMFRDYAHRAEVFIDTVRDLASGEGALT